MIDGFVLFIVVLCCFSLGFVGGVLRTQFIADAQEVRWVTRSGRPKMTFSAYTIDKRDPVRKLDFGGLSRRELNAACKRAAKFERDHAYLMNRRK